MNKWRFLFQIHCSNTCRPKVPWTNATQANLVKSKVEFHRYVLQTALDLIQSHKNTKLLNKQEAKEVYDGCTEMASILYDRCILPMKEFIDFDLPTAILAAECFQNIVALITTQYGSNFQNFLSTVGKKNT